MSDKRLPGTLRGVSPCTECTERFIACHDRCPKDERGEFGYKAWLAEVQKIKDKKKAYDNLDRRKSWQKTNY